MNSLTWLYDANGNRCSVEYFGSRDAAQAALESLVNCRNCRDCAAADNLLEECKRNGDSAPGRSGALPVPIIADIHKAVYAACSVPGALNMSIWHTCATTHCRAGWIVTLAGDAGLELEAFYGTLQAALLIYNASDPEHTFNPCRFYDDNSAALADMKRLAEASA